MPFSGGDGLWSAIAAGGLAVIGFFVWGFRKIFHAAVDNRVSETDNRVSELETRLDRYYMTADQTAKFFGELMSPVHTSLGEIKEENREMRGYMQDQFREVRQKLDNKKDRREANGTR